MRGRKKQPIEGLNDHDFAALAASNASRREKRRYLAFWHIQQGKSFLATAKEVGVDVRSLMRWVKSFKKNGMNGLSDQPGRGKKPMLSPQQKEAFKQALMEMPKPISAKQAMVVLQEKTGLKSSLSTMYNLLKDMDMSWVTKKTRPL